MTSVLNSEESKQFCCFCAEDREKEGIEIILKEGKDIIISFVCLDCVKEHRMYKKVVP